MVTEIQNSSCRMAHECGKFKRKPGYESQPVRQRMTGVSFCSQIVKQSHEKVDKDGIQCKKSDDVKGQPEQMDFWCGVKYRTEPNKNGSHDRRKKNECTKKVSRTHLPPLFRLLAGLHHAQYWPPIHVREREEDKMGLLVNGDTVSILCKKTLTDFFDLSLFNLKNRNHSSF